MKKFLMLSRTWKTDYHVTESNGTQAKYDDEREFFESLKDARIIDTERNFAVIFTRGLSVYFLAGGIRTGSKDKDGRAIRFAFYAKFKRSEYVKAKNIFLGLVNNWDNLPKIINSCINPEAYKLEKIIFNREKFIARLEDYRPDINFNEKSQGYIFIPDEKRIAALRPARKNIISSKMIMYSVIVVIACVIVYFVPEFMKDKHTPPQPVSENIADNSELEALSGDIYSFFNESEHKYKDSKRSQDIYILTEYQTALYVKTIFQEIYISYSDDAKIIGLVREALNLSANIKDAVTPQGAEIYSDMARSKIDEAKELLDNIHNTD